MGHSHSHSHGPSTEQYSSEAHKKVAYRVEIVGIVFNVILTAFKLIAGLLGRSAAMVSDAVHSLSDVLAGFVVIVGVGMSAKKADKEHPYGHERMECVAAIILAVVLCVVGVGIGFSAAGRVINKETLAVPGMIALIAAIASIVIKEGLYWYTIAAAKKINSTALKASAWHHRSDAFSSIGSFIGILGARMGLPILDPIACFIICILIVKAGIDIFRDALDKMMDRAMDDESIEEIRELAQEQHGVCSVDKLYTRLFGNRAFVEISIGADATLSLAEAHEIADQVHDEIEEHFPMVKHCAVHVNPVELDPSKPQPKKESHAHAHGHDHDHDHSEHEHEKEYQPTGH